MTSDANHSIIMATARAFFGIYSIFSVTEMVVDLRLMSAPELAAELGERVRRERLRQDLTQRTLAERAGVARLTITRMEADGTATLGSFLAALIALRRSGDLDQVLQPPEATTVEQFLSEEDPARQRGSR